MTRDEMIPAYRSPGRHYHDLRHIEDCLAKLDRVAGLQARDREILTEAIWWHDVVYDPTRATMRSGALNSRSRTSLPLCGTRSCA